MDDASEYGRLLAERDRLIAAGVDPDDLDVPLAPVTGFGWSADEATAHFRRVADAMRQAIYGEVDMPDDDTEEA